MISVLLFVCPGAVEPAVLSSRMVITQGAVFSEELNNSSSLLFKTLAFDVQNMVRSQAFILKITGSINLKQHLTSSAFIVKDSKASVLINISVNFLSNFKFCYFSDTVFIKKGSLKVHTIKYTL